MTDKDIGAEIDARNARFAARERYAHGWTDWRAIYGTRVTLRYRLRCWVRDALRPRVRRAWRWLWRPFG